MNFEEGDTLEVDQFSSYLYMIPTSECCAGTIYNLTKKSALQTYIF